MFWKSLIGALTFGCSTTLSVVPTLMAISTHSIENFEKTYDVSFQEISSIEVHDFHTIGSTCCINLKDVKGAIGLPNNFFNHLGIASLNFRDYEILDQISNVYSFSIYAPISKIKDIMFNSQIINVKMKVKHSIQSNTFHIQSFSANLKPKLPKSSIPLPRYITDFSGKYQYSQIVENLNYLMVKRQDFDKFDYNYLYWVPIFNFLYDTKIDRKTIISVQWLDLNNIKLQLIIADETQDKFEHLFSIGVGHSKFELVVNSCCVSLLYKNKEIEHKLIFSFSNPKTLFSYFESVFFNDFLHVFFGDINYMGNTYNFLRYDSYLKSDFIGFMDYWFSKKLIYSIQDEWFKNYKDNDVYGSIYLILGDFFYCMFYATFDMDIGTRVKIDFRSESDSWKEKDCFFELGFLYRSLITFYPKRYLFSGEYEGVNNNILFRSFYFLTDKKIHNDFISGKTSYCINFNVLKMYDNLMFKLPKVVNISTIDYFNANFDVQYGINIFTLSFPLLTNINEKPQYTFYIYNFNILNSTAFIPDSDFNDYEDLIPLPKCNPSISSVGGWACILQQQAIRVINFLTRVSGLNFLLKPMVSIGQTVLKFFSGTFEVFDVVPVFKYLFTFLIGFSIFVVIFRFFL